MERGRPGENNEDEDAIFWLGIAPDQRARVTWELSEELFTLALENGGVLDNETGTLLTAQEGESCERRLPRSAFRVERR
ncbi:MAG: hypothetical protein WKG00_01340 [Polyangiaceae bacterium]